MAKEKRASFFCSSCGHEEPRWFGRCPGCQAWNTASEAPAARKSGAFAGESRRRWAPAGAAPPAPRELSGVAVLETPRQPTGLAAPSIPLARRPQTVRR